MTKIDEYYVGMNQKKVYVMYNKVSVKLVIQLYNCLLFEHNTGYQENIDMYIELQLVF